MTFEGRSYYVNKCSVGFLLSLTFYTFSCSLFYFFFFEVASAMLMIVPIMLGVACWFFFHLRWRHDYIIGSEYPLEDGVFAGILLSITISLFYVFCCAPDSEPDYSMDGGLLVYE